MRREGVTGWLLALCGGLLLSGCVASRQVAYEAGAGSGVSEAVAGQPEKAAADGSQAEPLSLVATYSREPLKIDGRLDEKVWRETPVYLLTHVRRGGGRFPMAERASVRIAWTDTHLVVAGEFEDTDIVDNARKNQALHYDTGDTMELFLKPESQRWYWEIYGTPRGFTTTLFYASRGRLGLQPWPFVKDSKVRVGVTYDGVVNDHARQDKGFIIELAVPLSELAAAGEPLTPQGGTWRILVGRYNWSAFSEAYQSELSSLPAVHGPNFHAYERWARLELRK